jgi:hypothetical protein
MAAKFYAPTCPECKGTNVTANASAKWDVMTQAWALAVVHKLVTCHECGHETTQPAMVKQPVDDLPPPSADTHGAGKHDA